MVKDTRSPEKPSRLYSSHIEFSGMSFSDSRNVPECPHSQTTGLLVWIVIPEGFFRLAGEQARSESRYVQPSDAAQVRLSH